MNLKEYERRLSRIISDLAVVSAMCFAATVLIKVFVNDLALTATFMRFVLGFYVGFTVVTLFRVIRQAKLMRAEKDDDNKRKELRNEE